MSTFDFNDILSLPIFCFSGFRKFEKNEHHITRTTSEHILILMLDGTLNFSENGKELSVSKNEYYIQKAGFFQDGKLPSNLPYYYFIHFKGVFEDNLFGLPLKGTFSYSDIIDLVNSLNSKHLSPTSTFLETQIAFLRILDRLGHKPSEPINADIKRILSIIQENYFQDISLDLISKEVNYSKDYIIKQFKLKYGITPHQYIIKIRVEEAKKLLISSNKKISEISLECGFNDVSTFHRAFLKETHSTPIQYRKDHS